jgi:hypothetical protein
MGGDGGSIASDRKFIRGTTANNSDGSNQQKASYEDQRGLTCELSQVTLDHVIVADELGRLYDKEMLLTALIEKTLPEKYSYIRGLKDIKTLQFKLNPLYNAADRDSKVCKYICPITSQEFNGIIPFIYIWSTGYVLSENGYSEIGVQNLQEEYGPFNDDDIIRLFPADIETMTKNMENRRNKSKEAKKQSKKRNNDVESLMTNNESKNDVETEPKKHKVSSETASMKSKTKLTSSISTIAAKAVMEQETKSDVFKSLFHKKDPSKTSQYDSFLLDGAAPCNF